ncbi:hypothetical protein D3C85_1142180 [compost metagenome]
MTISGLFKINVSAVAGKIIDNQNDHDKANGNQGGPESDTGEINKSAYCGNKIGNQNDEDIRRFPNYPNIIIQGSINIPPGYFFKFLV